METEIHHQSKRNSTKLFQAETRISNKHVSVPPLTAERIIRHLQERISFTSKELAVLENFFLFHQLLFGVIFDPQDNDNYLFQHGYNHMSVGPKIDQVLIADYLNAMKHASFILARASRVENDESWVQKFTQLKDQTTLALRAIKVKTLQQKKDGTQADRNEYRLQELLKLFESTQQRLSTKTLRDMWPLMLSWVAFKVPLLFARFALHKHRLQMDFVSDARTNEVLAFVEYAWGDISLDEFTNRMRIVEETYNAFSIKRVARDDFSPKKMRGNL